MYSFVITHASETKLGEMEVTQDVAKSEGSNLFVRSSITRTDILRRVLVALLLLDYMWILNFAWSTIGWWWSPEGGLWWSSGGPGQFFPFPKPPGMLTVITRASPFDQVFYPMFMHGYVWIFWMFLGWIYIFSPYRLNTGLMLSRIRRRGR
ncbi:MAG: hypothetical protein ACE5H4_16095 [Candidatus Thorarchaeota archaeon]